MSSDIDLYHSVRLNEYSQLATVSLTEISHNHRNYDTFLEYFCSIGMYFSIRDRNI